MGQAYTDLDQVFFESPRCSNFIANYFYRPQFVRTTRGFEGVSRSQVLPNVGLGQCLFLILSDRGFDNATLTRKS